MQDENMGRVRFIESEKMKLGSYIHDYKKLVQEITETWWDVEPRVMDNYRENKYYELADVLRWLMGEQLKATYLLQQTETLCRTIKRMSK